MLLMNSLGVLVLSGPTVGVQQAAASHVSRHCFGATSVGVMSAGDCHLPSVRALQAARARRRAHPRAPVHTVQAGQSDGAAASGGPRVRTKLPPPHVHTSQPPLLMVNTYSTVTFSRKYLRLDTQAEINLCRTYRTYTGSSKTEFPKSGNSRLNETGTFFSWEEAINYRRRKQPPSAGAPYHRNILKDNTRRRQKVPTTVIYEQKSF